MMPFQAMRLRRAGAVSAEWSTIVSFTPDSVSDGWDAYTFRRAIEVPALSGATRLRFTLRCANGKQLNVGKLYVGNRSGDYAFAEPPMQVFFDGLPGFAASAATDVVSDPVDLVVTGNAIVLSAYFNGPTSLPYLQNGEYDQGNVVNGNGFYKPGDDAANVSPAGYSIWTWPTLFVRVEKFG